jgi:hypothetical protein
MLITLLIVTVVAFSASGNALSDGEKNLVLITILGLVGNAIPSMLALLKSESTQHELRNGLIGTKVKEAVTEMATDPSIDSVTIESGAICSVISESGRNGEPLGCGYRIGHTGNHSWASLPTFPN